MKVQELFENITYRNAYYRSYLFYSSKGKVNKLKQFAVSKNYDFRADHFNSNLFSFTSISVSELIDVIHYGLINKLISYHNALNKAVDEFVFTPKEDRDYSELPETLNYPLKLLKLGGFLTIEDMHKKLKSVPSIDFNCSLKGPVLGLLKIKNLEEIKGLIHQKELKKILNKYLPGGDLLECQEELMNAGFEEFAQL